MFTREITTTRCEVRLLRMPAYGVRHQSRYIIELRIAQPLTLAYTLRESRVPSPLTTPRSALRLFRLASPRGR